MDGTIVTSPDGITWTPKHGTARPKVRNVKWLGKQLVAVAEGAVLTSPDGDVWTTAPLKDPSYLYSVAASTTHLVASMPGVVGGISRATVYGVDGERVWGLKLGHPANELRIPTADMARRVYLLEVEGAGKMATQAFTLSK